MAQNNIATAEIDLTNCDKEPIHISGHIQPHGVMFVVKEPQLKILQMSNNTFEFFGLHPSSLIDKDLSVLFDPIQIESLKSCLIHENLKTVNPLKLTIGTAYNPLTFDCILHRNEGLLIIEIEPASSKNNLSVFSFYHSVKTTLSKIQSTGNLQDLCQTIVAEVRKFTDFDRVMVYKFDPEGNGSVIAEDKEENLSPFLGLRYPTSDIPKQARKLYSENWLRLIPEINYKPVELIPRNNPLTNQPLDLSFSILRSVSPIHIEYLQNMGVAASMSISLMKKQKLWGLIACHHYAPKYIPYEVRAACEFIGQVMSLELEFKEGNEDYDYRLKLKSIQARLLENISQAENLSQALVKSQQSLLDLVSATGAAVLFGENCYLVGQTPEKEALKQLIEWGQKNITGEVFHTDSLSKFYENAEQLKDTASGCLAISISPSQKIYVLWFRPEVIQTVNWAGNPNKPIEIEANGNIRLSPRKSFELWKETVKYTSLPWKDCEIEAAIELRNSMINIVLLQAEKLANLNAALQQSELREREKSTQLEKLLQELQRTQTQLVQTEKMSSLGQLVAGVAHEINNPINFIYGNISHADEYTRDLIELINLYQQYYPSPVSEIQEASETMEIDFLITDLPKLQASMKIGAERICEIVQSLRNFSRIDEAEMKPVDIHDGLDSTLLILSNRLKPKPDRPAIHLTKEYGSLPLVECYVGQLNQVFMNVLSNAIDALEESFINYKTAQNDKETKYKGKIRIRTEFHPKRETVSIHIYDNGPGMTEEIRQRITEPFFTTKPVGKGTGIGLAISYQIIAEKHGGKMTCISTPGEGTEFIIEIPLHQSHHKPRV
ncbi:ATP-binding protein [Phormidium nigroviride]